MKCVTQFRAFGYSFLLALRYGVEQNEDEGDTKALLRLYKNSDMARSNYTLDKFFGDVTNLDKS